MLGLEQTTWIDFETGDQHTERTIETHVYEQETQIIREDLDPDTMQYNAGYELSIQSVSNYLWYSLDTWGRNNAGSPVAQCGTTGDCLGQDFNT